MNFHVPEETVKNIVVCTAGYIEPVLCSLREKIEEKQAAKHLDGTLVGLCVYMRLHCYSIFLLI